MKYNPKDIALFVLAVVVVLLLLTLIIRRRPAPPADRQVETALRDSLLSEYRARLARDSADLRARDARIAELEKQQLEKAQERVTIQQKQQTVKRKREDIQKHIASDSFDRDSLRGALSEFE